MGIFNRGVATKTTEDDEITNERADVELEAVEKFEKKYERVTQIREGIAPLSVMLAYDEIPNEYKENFSYLYLKEKMETIGLTKEEIREFDQYLQLSDEEQTDSLLDSLACYDHLGIISQSAYCVKPEELAEIKNAVKKDYSKMPAVYIEFLENTADKKIEETDIKNKNSKSANASKHELVVYKDSIFIRLKRFIASVFHFEY